MFKVLASGKKTAAPTAESVSIFKPSVYTEIPCSIKEDANSRNLARISGVAILFTTITERSRKFKG